MKSTSDPRHIKRIKLVKLLFAESFTHQGNLTKKATEILSKSDPIDKKIEVAAPTWPVDKLNKNDLAILRLAIYELDEGKTPPKVVIDEAVELAKEFGSENSSSFVNGVLGTIYNEDDENTDKERLKEKKVKKEPETETETPVEEVKDEKVEKQDEAEAEKEEKDK